MKLIRSVRVVTTSSRIWHHGRVARKIARIGRLRKVGQGCSVGIVRVVGKLSWSQRLSRIHAGSAEELAISGNVELRIGANWKLVCHGRTSRCHAAGERDTCKLIEHGVHGDVLVLQTGSRSLLECGALTLGVIVCAILRLLGVHV